MHFLIVPGDGKTIELCFEINVYSGGCGGTVG
jgi:hypothetical protein